MRIVKSLEGTKLCPNCGSVQLLDNHTVQGRDYMLCIECGEEIYENEYTISAEEAQEHTFNIGKAPDDIDDTLMDIEYELGQLTLWAHDKYSLDQLEAIKSILEQFLSVLRRMK